MPFASSVEGMLFTLTCMPHSIMDSRLLLIGEERKLKIIMNPEVLVINSPISVRHTFCIMYFVLYICHIHMYSVCDMYTI